MVDLQSDVGHESVRKSVLPEQVGASRMPNREVRAHVGNARYSAKCKALRLERDPLHPLHHSSWCTLHGAVDRPILLAELRLLKINLGGNMTTHIQELERTTQT